MPVLGMDLECSNIRKMEDKLCKNVEADTRYVSVL